MIKFMGIGAQKCGTTWLYTTLSQYPDIQFPGKKELHYWDELPRGNLETYTKKFNKTDKFEGEITPAYGFLPISTIKEIHRWTPPNIKIIYMIRNPIDRAWSSAKMALKRAEMVESEASDQWFIDHFRSKGSLVRGDFEFCIRNWRAVFDEKDILITRYEDLCLNPLELANSCLSHIGINHNLSTADQKDNLSKKQFSGEDLPIRKKLHKELLIIYSDKIKSLQNYLEIDLADWISEK